MMNEAIDKVYGRTVSEWIASMPAELRTHAVSLWHVSASGANYFELTGIDLRNFIERGIVALLGAGAIPVKSGKGTSFEWIAEQEYGIDKNDIARVIMRQWDASSKDDNYLFSIWFALPGPYVGNVAT